MKNSNLAGKIRTIGNTSNERSLYNKTGVNADSKSLDGLSCNFNKVDNAQYINKDVLLHDLLESKILFLIKYF